MKFRAFFAIDFDIDFLSRFGFENAFKMASEIDPQAQKDARIHFFLRPWTPQDIFRVALAAQMAIFVAKNA